MSKVNDSKKIAYEKIETFVGRNKPIVFSGLVIVLIVIMVSISVISKDDPDQVIQDFSNAVRQDDIDELEDLISLDDEEMELDEQKLQQFIDLCQNSPGYFKQQMWQLDAQKSIHDPKSEMSTENPLYGTDGISLSDIKNMGSFYLKKEEGFFSDSYKIGVRPYYITISSNEPDAIIMMDGEEVFKSTKKRLKKRIGPLMPGKYHFTGSKKFPYAKVTNKKVADLFMDGGEHRETEVSLNLSGKKIEIESSFSDTQVFVGKKKVGKVEDLKKFGPVSGDGSIKIYGEKEFPWGRSKSPVKKVTENTESIDVTPMPFADKKGKQNLIDTINAFAKERILAQVKLNPSVFTVAGDNVVKEYTEEIEETKEWSFKDLLKGKALGTRIDFGHLEFTKEEGLYTVKIPVEFHDKTNQSDLGIDKDNPLRERFEEMVLTLTYDEKKKKWLVSSTRKLYHLGSDLGYFKGKDVEKSEFN